MPEGRLQGRIHAVLNNQDKGMQVRFRDPTNKTPTKNPNKHLCIFVFIIQVFGGMDAGNEAHMDVLMAS
ncbi:MAG: hypothetical protein GY781_13270 [Gammaproteobacteria bacterium]|nr:hypothetical protein [Gammaproteobacteria bacterium]